MRGLIGKESSTERAKERKWGESGLGMVGGPQELSGVTAWPTGPYGKERGRHWYCLASLQPAWIQATLGCVVSLAGALPETILSHAWWAGRPPVLRLPTLGLVIQKLYIGCSPRDMQD